MPSLPQDRAVVLLLRHAERPAIPPGETGQSLSLTERGARAAEALGEALGERIRRVNTSPVPRCVETAAAIRRGASILVDIVPDRWLGDPGPYVHDPSLAFQNWLELGPEGVIEALVHGRKGLAGMHDPDAAARRLLGHLERFLDEAAGLHIAVTHDIVLVATIARLWAEPLERPWWPGFLDAAALFREGDSLVLAYRDRAEVVGRGER
ncbi:histidine phosphatase family protein [Polyangium sp. y55x31]|uniref:histidine phosphatase family protein n=1 Tax=Polyangium sp. y55x31 TaxID=3042688 RepID=UPI002482E62C|nr:histidine phosphatase family protein [Polyangium sp. y55x31]MDI1481309.1 histidine phosphatase family protein [Polyangium sp. y55x31]